MFFSFLNLFLFFYVFSSKRDNELLLRLIANLNMLLKDESVNVVKKAILTLTQLYKVTLQVNTDFSDETFSSCRCDVRIFNINQVTTTDTC